MPKKQAGFTLIELMVTIVIVAILSGVGLTVFAQAQIVSRDDKRKQDIKTYQTAFELFYEKHGSYPAYLGGLGGGQWDSSPKCHPTEWLNMFHYHFDAAGNQVIDNTENTSNYISQVSVDPINDCHFHYNYRALPVSGPGAGQDYVFCISLENTNDPGYDPGYWGAQNPVCTGHDFGVFGPTH